MRYKLFLVGSQAASSVCAFVLTYYLASAIGKYELGVYAFYSSLSLAIANLISSPLGIWLTRSQAQPEASLQVIRWIWVAIGTTLCVAGIGAYAGLQHLSFGAVAYCGLSILTSRYLFGWNSVGRRGLFAMGILLQSSLRAAVIIALVAGAGPAGADALMVATVAVSMVTLWSLRGLDAGGRNALGARLPVPSRHEVFTQLKTGRVLLQNMLLSSLVFTAYQYFDRLVARYSVGYAGVAELALLIQWSFTIITVALQPFVTLAYPRILQVDAGGARPTLKKYVYLFLGVTAVAASATHLFAGTVAGWMPAGYASLAALIPIEIAAGGLFMLGQLYSVWLFRRGNEHYNLVLVVVSSVVGIGAIHVLGHAHGLPGIAAAHLLFSTVYLGLCLMLVRRTAAR